MKSGDILTFVASKANTGCAAINRCVITVKKNGKPVTAGDIKAGQTIRVNINTGELEENNGN